MGFLRLGSRGGLLRPRPAIAGVVTPPPSGTLGWPNPNGDGSGTLLTFTLGGGPNNLGAFDDDTGSGIGLDKAGSYGWSEARGYERPGDAEGFFPYATLAQLPDGGANCLSFRHINPTYAVALFVPSWAAYVAFEYKDNWFSPTLNARYPKPDGITVNIGGVDAAVRLPTLRDRKWKRAVVQVPAGATLTNGRYRIKLGGNNGDFGGNEFMGNSLMHRVIASSVAIPARPSVDGFWKTVTPNITTGDLRDRAGNPWVPIMGNHGGSTETNQVQQGVLMGCNTMQASLSAEGSGNRTWSPNVVTWTTGSVSNTQRGLPNEVANIVAAGMMAFPYDEKMADLGFLPYQAGWGAPPYTADGTWRGEINIWKNACQNYFASSTSIPFVYLKDEWDHDDTIGWGALEEMVIELRYWASVYCPGVPTAVANMGWKPNLPMKASWELADFNMVDRYLESTAPGLSEFQAVAAFQEEMRAFAGTKAWLGVHNLILDAAAHTVYTVTQVRPLVYFSLCAGARGIWYFGNPYMMSDPLADAHFRSFKPLSDEVAALADVIHATSTELGKTRPTLAENVYPQTHATSGTGVTANVNISTIYKQAPSAGRKVLMAVNCTMTAQSSVVFTVAGLTVGQVVTVLFESRTITVTTAGQFTDSFASLARHVYQMP